MLRVKTETDCNQFKALSFSLSAFFFTSSLCHTACLSFILSVSLLQCYHCLNPLTVTDTRDSANVKQMYLLTFFFFCTSGAYLFFCDRCFDSLRLCKI